MNGHYKIPLPADWDQPLECYPPIARLIRAFDRGAEYYCEIKDEKLQGCNMPRYVEIVAVGGKALPHKPAARSSGVPMLSREQIEKRLADAKRQPEGTAAWLAKQLREQSKVCVPRSWRNCNSYDHVARLRMRHIGHGIAAICARHTKTRDWQPDRADYKQLEILLGFAPLRWSKLPKHMRGKGYIGFLVSRYANGNIRRRRESADLSEPKEPTATAIEETLLARVDMEYWREMQRLAQEKDDQLWHEDITLQRTNSSVRSR